MGIEERRWIMKRILAWCKMMVTQKNGRVLLSKVSPEEPEIISSFVEVEESTIFLNRREASFINKEVRRLLKARLAEEERKKKEGIPSRPAPGKITYAVYQ